MEISKLNLSKIKVAIFDFDNTLAIHKDQNYLKKRRSSEDKFLDYYLNAYLNQNSFYESIEECNISNDILTLINILRKNGVKLYCLTGTKFSFHINAKENFVHKNYGNDIEIFAVGNQQFKLSATKIISKINKCGLDEILFVDDLVENVDMLNNAGIKAIVSADVINFI